MFVSIQGCMYVMVVWLYFVDHNIMLVQFPALITACLRQEKDILVNLVNHLLHCGFFRDAPDNQRCLTANKIKASRSSRTYILFTMCHYNIRLLYQCTTEVLRPTIPRFGSARFGLFSKPLKFSLNPFRIQKQRYCYLSLLFCCSISPEFSGLESEAIGNIILLHISMAVGKIVTTLLR